MRKRKAVLGASIISAKGEVKMEDVGLVCGHAYSILKVKEVTGMKFVQLRNPWGSFEWKGAWSDHSMLWDTYPKVKEKLKYTKSDDGLFWMSFSDFCRHFGRLDGVCVGCCFLYDHFSASVLVLIGMGAQVLKLPLNWRSIKGDLMLSQ